MLAALLVAANVMLWRRCANTDGGHANMKTTTAEAAVRLSMPHSKSSRVYSAPAASSNNAQKACNAGTFPAYNTSCAASPSAVDVCATYSCFVEQGGSWVPSSDADVCTASAQIRNSTDGSVLNVTGQQLVDMSDTAGTLCCACPAPQPPTPPLPTTSLQYGDLITIFSNTLNEYVMDEMQLTYTPNADNAARIAVVNADEPTKSGAVLTGDRVRLVRYRRVSASQVTAFVLCGQNMAVALSTSCSPTSSVFLISQANATAGSQIPDGVSNLTFTASGGQMDGNCMGGATSNNMIGFVLASDPKSLWTMYSRTHQQMYGPVLEGDMVLLYNTGYNMYVSLGGSAATAPVPAVLSQASTGVWQVSKRSAASSGTAGGIFLTSITQSLVGVASDVAGTKGGPDCPLYGLKNGGGHFFVLTSPPTVVGSHARADDDLIYGAPYNISFSSDCNKGFVTWDTATSAIRICTETSCPNIATSPADFEWELHPYVPSA